MSHTMPFVRDDVAFICDRLSAGLNEIVHRMPAAPARPMGRTEAVRPEPSLRTGDRSAAAHRPGVPLAQHYHYAAARLAVDHAERRLAQALASFVQSLDVPVERPASLAEQLSKRLAQLREDAAPNQLAVLHPGDARHAVRRAA